MQTFDLYDKYGRIFINNPVGTDEDRLNNAVAAGRAHSEEYPLYTVDVTDSATGEVVATFENGARTWPPNDTVLTTRAEWTH